MSNHKTIVALLTTLAVVLATSLCTTNDAFAQPSTQSGSADPEKLFADASALAEQGKFAEALVKFEEAQRLDPGIGTQFNIAVCYEKLGKLATAWRNFESVRQLAQASGKKQREEAARVKLAAITPRLSGYVLRAEEKASDLVVRIDGVIVAKSSWSFWPVDPGVHTIEASASTKKPWSMQRNTPPEGTKEDIVIPALDVVEGKTVLVTKETTNTRRTIGYVLGGVGVLGAAGATITGLMLLSARSTADQHCTPKCIDSAGNFDQTGADAVSLGKTLLPINAIAWGVAVVGIGGGAYLIFTSPKKTTSSALAPVLAPNVLGASATGTF